MSTDRMQQTLDMLIERAQRSGTTTPDCTYRGPTDRCFSRTMVGASGAFARTAEYATAIDAPEPVLIGPIDMRPSAGEALLWAVCIVIGAALPAVLPWAR